MPLLIAPGQRGRTSAAERANILNKIADRLEANLEMLTDAEMAYFQLS